MCLCIMIYNKKEKVMNTLALIKRTKFSRPWPIMLKRMVQTMRMHLRFIKRTKKLGKEYKTKGWLGF